MTSTRIIAPEFPVLTLDQIKRHLRIDTNHDDETLTQLAATATDFMERDCGLSMIDQTWRFYLDELPKSDVATITLRPARSIISVTAYNADGAPETVPADLWFFNTISEPARLRFMPASHGLDMSNGLEIDVRAGFGATGADVPDSIKQALLVLIAHWYEFRSAFSAGDQPVSVPEAYTRQAALWRRKRL